MMNCAYANVLFAKLYVYARVISLLWPKQQTCPPLLRPSPVSKSPLACFLTLQFVLSTFYIDRAILVFVSFCYHTYFVIYCLCRCTYNLITIHPCPVKVSVSQMCLCRCVHFTPLGHTLKSGRDGSLLGVSFIFIGVAVFTEMIDPL